VNEAEPQQQQTWTSTVSVNFGDAPGWGSAKATTTAGPTTAATTTTTTSKAADTDIPSWLSKGSSAFGPSASFGQTSTFGGANLATATFGGQVSTFGAFGQAASFGSLAGASVFGAGPSDNEEEDGSGDDNNDDAAQAPAEWGAGGQDADDLPPPTDVASGEEGEVQVYQTRVKLFKLQKKDDKPSWIEVGHGPLRVNVPIVQPSEDGVTKKPRIIMRRQGVLKLLLNAAIQPEMAFETVGDKMMRFTCESFTDDNPKGAIASFLVKCSRTDERDMLIETIYRVRPRKAKAGTPEKSSSLSTSTETPSPATASGQPSQESTTSSPKAKAQS
jgi:hypothetical protein